MKNNNICLDCGKDYAYDSDNPLGASSLRCCACRKKDSARNKKITLFLIAAGGKEMKCKKCGYHKCEDALVLANTKSFLTKATNEEEKKKRAHTQYLLCLNCETEIKSGQIEACVVDSSSYPVAVDFYEREVQIVRKKIEPVERYSKDAIEAEIYTGSGSDSVRQVAEKTRLIGGETIDVSSL